MIILSLSRSSSLAPCWLSPMACADEAYLGGERVRAARQYGEHRRSGVVRFSLPQSVRTIEGAGVMGRKSREVR